MNNILDKMKEKCIKQKILTLVLVTVVIAAYFEINILVDKLNFSNIDMTDSKLYSLTNESKEKIKKINEKLEIELINFEQYAYLSNVLNSANIIKEYSKLNSNIIVTERNSSEESVPLIIFKYKDKTNTISIDNLYDYEFSTETYLDESIDITEEVITNAIIDITSENKNNIYLYINHSSYKEYADKYFATLIKSIESKINNFEYLNLAEVDNVPENCDCLIIPNLSEDISDKEKDILINYINNGGNILVLQESLAVVNADLPNFQSIMDLYGIKLSNGIIMENNKNNMVNNIPEFIIAKINNNSTIGNKLNENSKLLLVDAGKIDFKDEDTLNTLNVSYEIIAQTSEEAFYRKDLTVTDFTKIDSDENASNAILAALVTKNINDEKTSKLIIFSNSIFATDSTAIPIKDIVTGQSKKIKAINYCNNKELLENAILYLSNNNESMIIRKKYFDNIPTMKILENGSVVEILYGVPMFIILIGYIVWRIRKNKK